MSDSQLKSTFIKGLLLSGLLMLSAQAAPEISGDYQTAQQAAPALAKLTCSPELFDSTSHCQLTSVRVIGDWALTGWLAGEAGGQALLRKVGKSWKYVSGGGGAMNAQEAVAAGVPQATAEFLVPIYPMYEADDLQRASAWELLVLRNMIYARHGRSFSHPRLQKYFQSWPWYKARANYSDTLLSPAERKQIEAVLRVEKQKGYFK